MMSQTFQTIRQIHEGYEKKLLSPIELTQEYFRSIHKSTHNAYLTLCEDRALQQAKVADQILAAEGKVPSDQYPLFGIPMGIKDILVMEGVRTTCGSKMLENYIPPYTATAVQRLENAGAIVLGKLNMDEFAMGGSNENSAFGPVTHPDFPDRVPGGSSGGSATAVKANLCVAALGTDTGGSIRLPASYCGIVGLKPTYGQVSRYGLVAFASSLDQIGPMTKTVDDAARVFSAMAGVDPRDSTSAPMGGREFARGLEEKFTWKGLKVGVPKEYFVEGIKPEVAARVQEAIQWIQSQGATLVPISLPHTSYSVAVYYIVAVSEASSNLARFDGVRFGMRSKEAGDAPDLAAFYKKNRAAFGAEVKRRIILGTFALSSGYYDAYYKKACQVRRLISRDFDRAFEQVDIIAGPVSTGTAFKKGEKSKDPLQMYLNDIFTIPVNLAGLPALSVPCGVDASSGAALPVGLHLIGPQFSEQRLLNAAHDFERSRT